MIPLQDVDRVAASLTFLKGLGLALLQEFTRHATIAAFPTGRDIMVEGDRAHAIPIVLSGEIRVFRIGDTGREITLYRFGPGECCVLTANSILGNESFPANARVEEAVEVAFLPAAVFEDWLARSPVWRHFIFDAMARRFTSLISTLDDVAFRRMDTRVSHLLLERTRPGAPAIRITHQEIADELGSSREVVSRILEELQSRGHVRLFRGGVEVIEPGQLSRSTAS